MTKKIWELYAEIWSLPAKKRRARLTDLTTPDVTYLDPTTPLAGAEALSNYMANFQTDVPGGYFVITDAYEHHQQTLAHWKMLGQDGTVMMLGTSHACLTEGGKFASLAGFFGGTDA